ncbi:MAG: diguanylate cyclase [Gemmatimonas sp.]
MSSGEVLPGMVFRSRPRLILLDGRAAGESGEIALSTCTRLKRDSFSGIIPLAIFVSPLGFAEAFAAGADEVIREGVDDADALVRMRAMLRRSDRDIDVHPSTRLPGTREIAAELARRIESRDKFAVCYADLDHFKEFNDRYSYFRGNEVIQLLARLLHDVIKGLCGEEGFVGHIGGDDFLYVVPIAAMPRVCDEVIRVFDELVPLQYSAHDQRVGYFFGKDRRGQLHKVPLMTLSVGVVTNQRRRFVRASEVSELATEMKSYAKTLPGSVWAVDRRRDEVATEGQPAAATPARGSRVASHADHTTSTSSSDRTANRSSVR